MPSRDVAVVTFAELPAGNKFRQVRDQVPLRQDSKVTPAVQG